MKDASKEYLMLREEILNMSNKIQNSIYLMFTASATILVFAVSQDDLFLLLIPYCVVIPIYCIADSNTNAYHKIAAYLHVFLEDGSGFKWETRQNLYFKNFIKKVRYLKDAQHLYSLF